MFLKKSRSFLCSFPLFLSLSVSGSYWHPDPVQWLGGEIDANFEGRKICDKPICISDASRMGLWINETANPCDNFYRYVCGSFLRYQALNDRYPIQGLQQLLYQTINEQRRKVLSQTVRDEDIRPVKIAKSMFQKCVDSNLIKSQERLNVIKFLDSLGGFPMYEGSSWNSSRFNKNKIFEDFPELAMDFFYTSFEVIKLNPSEFVVGFKSSFNNKNFRQNIPTLIAAAVAIGAKDMKIIEKDVNDAIDLPNYEDSSSTDYPDIRITISGFSKIMNKNLTTLKIDWKKILQNLMSFEVEDDFFIVVKNFPSAMKLIEVLDKIENRVFANYFMIRWLVEFRQLYSLYFVTANDNFSWGISKAQQRFEQCTKIVREKLSVAFTAMLVEKYAPKSLIDSAYEVASRSMEIFIKTVEKDESIPVENRNHMVEKLRTAKLIIGYPKELLNKSNIEKHFEDLKLDGSESFLKLLIQSYEFQARQKFKKYRNIDSFRLVLDESKVWAQHTLEDELWTPLYTFGENTIYYPTLWFQTPYFHPDRPRFYKDSMFGAFLAYTVSHGLEGYLKAENLKPENEQKNHFDLIQAIYDDYVSWDDENNEDPSLPAFLFSNKQMFWLTLIHKNCVKIQLGYKDDSNGEKNAEAYFQQNKHFHESFGCKFEDKNLTDEEKHQNILLLNDFY